MRRDLPWPQLAVQAAHAALEAGRRFLAKPSEPNPDEVDAQHPHLVVCGVANEVKLLSAASYLNKSDIPFVLFRESDLNNQATALATAPIVGQWRETMNRYHLLEVMMP